MHGSPSGIRRYSAARPRVDGWVDVDMTVGAQHPRSLAIAPDELPLAVTPSGVIRRATSGTSSRITPRCVCVWQRARATQGLLRFTPNFWAFALARAARSPRLCRRGILDVREAGASRRLPAHGNASTTIVLKPPDAALTATPSPAGPDPTTTTSKTAVAAASILESPSWLETVRHTGADTSSSPCDGRTVRNARPATQVRLRGCGIYYAATELEARACAGNAVAVVGGANSAGKT